MLARRELVSKHNVQIGRSARVFDASEPAGRRQQQLLALAPNIEPVRRRDRHHALDSALERRNDGRSFWTTPNSNVLVKNANVA